jgi:hypothetical protein
MVAHSPVPWFIVSGLVAEVKPLALRHRNQRTGIWSTLTIDPDPDLDETLKP